jgi:hypothetical protein
MSHHYSGPDFGFPHGDARLDFTDLYAFPKPGDDVVDFFLPLLSNGKVTGDNVGPH